MVELKGKELAQLRTKEIKEILFTLEQKRDIFYDEIANRKGRVEVIEEIIKEIYDKIIDINKEVQQQELKEGVEKKAEEENRKKQNELNAFEVSKRGIKTPRSPNPKKTRNLKRNRDKS